MNLKLSLELVPSSSFYNNVRQILTSQQWNILRKIVADKAYNLCQICGGVGPKHPVECHEVWAYDDKNLIQKLETMIALCPSCHMVKHMGFATIQGKQKQAIQHFRKINKLTEKQAILELNKSFKIWEERSRKIWALDISSLQEYGLKINLNGVL